MAGRGKRFEDVGYSFPKPLIDVEGKPMIQIIIENLNLPGKHIFLCQKEHYEKYLAWRTETGVIDALVEATVGEPSIRYFDVTDA